jgi:hypothetical protein
VSKLNFIRIIPGWNNQEYNSNKYIDDNEVNDDNGDNKDTNNIDNIDNNGISAIDLYLYPGEYLKETIKLQSLDINSTLLPHPLDNNTTQTQPLIRDLRMTIHEYRDGAQNSNVVVGFSSYALTGIVSNY